MERLKCKACGCFGMMPVDVIIEDEEQTGEEPESRFYSCHVCGDNWLSLKEEARVEGAQITFIHQMNVEPVLKRVALLSQTEGLPEQVTGGWSYYLGDEEIAAADWHDTLTSRRQVLKSICTN